MQIFSNIFGIFTKVEGKMGAIYADRIILISAVK